MPGPTIIAREGQNLKITVYNELPNVEGISIHWHGMHQRNNFLMDGVAFITKTPILTHQSYTYNFTARPSGIHWYHAHSGAQRTDGLYGALIVQDTILSNSNERLYDEDRPDQHTLLLMDWQKEPSTDLFHQTRSSLGFLIPITRNTSQQELMITHRCPQFHSGLASSMTKEYIIMKEFQIMLSQGRQYRLRLIGVQAAYAYKFSIQGHSLTVIATDGNRIDSFRDLNYAIVNSGERYDVIVNANNAGNVNYCRDLGSDK